MQHYWRLRDIPELCDVAASDRRMRWREAVSGGFSAWRMLPVYLLGFGGGSVLAAWIGRSSLWIEYGCWCLSWVVVYVAADHCWIQPRARRWLRAHPSLELQSRNIA